jgi:hypothetical protein
MEDDYPKIFGPKEASTIMSTWTEYLRLSKMDEKKYLPSSLG